MFNLQQINPAAAANLVPEDEAGTVYGTLAVGLSPAFTCDGSYVPELTYGAGYYVNVVTNAANDTRTDAPLGALPGVPTPRSGASW